MFKPKLALPKTVFDKIRVASEILGCTSVEEFAAKILEEEADRIIASTGSREVSQETVEEIAEKLKGLGYLE